MLQGDLLDVLYEIVIKLIFAPYISFFLLFPIIFIIYFFNESEVERNNKWINRLFIVFTPLVFIVMLEPNLFTLFNEFLNDALIRVQKILGLLISNHKLGIVTTIICFLYPIIIPVSSSISNRYTNGIYMFIFLYSFCFLVLSGIPLNAGLELLESSGLMDYGGLSALFIQLVVGFGPYIIYGIALLVVLIFWIACTTRVLYPINNSFDKND